MHRVDMGMLSVTLVLLNVLFLTANGKLCTDDVMAKLLDRFDEQQRLIDAQQRNMDAQQRQLDLLQNVVNQQQTEILHLTHTQVQDEDNIETSMTMNSTRLIEQPNNDDSAPKFRRKRQIPSEGTVAFTAVLTQLSTNLGLKQNIVFDLVETNVGNAYNVHHGVFVAPVPGIYVFHINIYTHQHQLAFCRIAVNGVDKASVYVQGGTISNAGSQTIVTKLNKGDDVAVQAMNQGDYVYSDGNIYSTFSGFLLQDLTELNSGGIVG